MLKGAETRAVLAETRSFHPKGDACEECRQRPVVALRAIQRLEKQLDLQGRLLGELKDAAPTVNVLVSLEWVCAALGDPRRAVALPRRAESCVVRDPGSWRLKVSWETDLLHGLDAVEWSRVRLGFDPDELQAQLLRSQSRRGLLNCTRQWGKSTATAAKALHHALYAPGSLSIVVSPGERQSAEWMRKVEGFAGRCGIQPRGDGDNAVSMLLPNGSRLVGLPG
jgi:hypothetical protein